MQVFKMAVRVAARHWGTLLIYVVFLGAFGMLAAGSVDNAETDAFGDDLPKVAVIDHDGSALSEALAGYIYANGTAVQVEDSEYGLQDAAAKDLASYVLVIPEGFEADVLQAASEGQAPRGLESIVSYQSARGALMEGKVGAFVQSVYGYLATSSASMDDALAWTEEAMEKQTPVDYIDVEVHNISNQFATFATFSTYSLFAGCAIFVSVGLSSLNRPEVRRRLSASSVSLSSYGLQVGAACVVLGLAIWAFVSFSGLAAYAGTLSGAPVGSIALVLGAQLAFAMVGTATGFLLWELRVVESVANAVGNIAGLALSFFAGSWVPLDMAGEAVQAIAQFTPGYWAVSVVYDVYEAPGLTDELVVGSLANIGIVVLFAIALACIGLVLGRLRAKDSAS